MNDTAPQQPLDLQEQIARIDRAIAETAKYTAEQRKLEPEARNFDRNFWQVLVPAMAAGPHYSGGRGFPEGDRRTNKTGFMSHNPGFWKIFSGKF